MSAFPNGVCECVLEGINHGFDTLIHGTQRLKSPEISSGIGEILVLEQELISQRIIEHEVWL
jgi:hypothetical protein